MFFSSGAGISIYVLALVGVYLSVFLASVLVYLSMFQALVRMYL